MPKSDLPQTQTYIDKYIRYQELYLRANKTASEVSEFNALENDLVTYLLRAIDFNILETNITNLTTTVNNHLLDIATTATANKILKLNAEAKLPASITGDSDTVDTKHASDFLQKSATANTNGYFDTSTTAPTGTQRLNYSGYFYATRVYNAVYNDYAEYFEKNEEVEAGDIVILNPNGNGYIKSRYAYDNLVVGVCSDSYGHILGGDGSKDVDDKYIPIGLAGRVDVKVVGKINKGDLLISSNIPGVAMKAEEYKVGTVIGKALEIHNEDNIKKIKMLIMNR